MSKPRFQASSDRALAVFRRLRIPDLPGKPTLGESCRPWVFDFVGQLFGGLNPTTRAQTIREALLLIPKKNFKTGIGAGIILTACELQERTDDELLLLSATKEVAGLSFRTAAGMVRADEDLSERYWVRDNIKTITREDTSTSIKVVSLNNATTAGSRASFVLVDELWLLGEEAKAEGALQEATGGLSARPEGFVCYLTTQSDKPPAGVFKDRLDYARKVKSGEVKDPSFLPVLYELPSGYNWRRNIEKAIEKVNPNLGLSVSKDWLLRQYEKVKDKRDGQLQMFLAKHLNVEIGMNLRTDRWVGADYWEQRQVDLTLDELLERSEVVEIGIDGGGLDDLLGFYVMGRERDTKRKLAWGHAWCNRIVLERRQEIAPRLLGFQSDGELSIVDAGEDVAELAAMVAKVRATGKLDRIGCDPVGLGGILEALQSVGVESEILGVSQGWKLGQHIQTAERWLSDGSLLVARQGLTSWCVGNARIEQRSNSILITKQASGKAKIDPVIALINCVALMSQNPAARGHKKLIAFSL